MSTRQTTFWVGWVWLASLFLIGKPVWGEEALQNENTMEGRKTGLVKNGGFEEVGRSGTNVSCPPWSFWQGTGRATGEFVTHDVHSGKVACKLKKGMRAVQEFKVKPGEDLLHIAFWAKGDKDGRWMNNACGSLQLTVSQYRKGQCVNTSRMVEGSAGMGIGDGVAVGAEWKQHFCRAAVASECDRIELAFTPTDWSRNIWLDDVSATLGGSIMNISCPPWTFGYGSISGDGEVEELKNANDMHFGKQACKLKGDVWAAQEVKAKAGDVLRIAFWAKGDKDVQARNNMYGAVKVTLFQYREGKCVNTRESAEVGLPRDKWKQCAAWLPPVPAREFDRLEVRFAPSDWSGAVWLDDVSVSVAGSLPLDIKGRVNVKVGKRIVVRKLAATSGDQPYNWFPFIQRMPNRTLVAWCQITADAYFPFGTENCHRMMSTDNGKTWKDISGEGTANFCKITLHDGTFLEIVGWVNGLIHKGDGWVMHVKRSRDNGMTYTIQKDVPVAIEHVRQDGVPQGQGRATFNTGLVEMDNGDLLAAIYVDFEGLPKCSSVLVKSTDKGNSWQYFSTIAYDPDAPGFGFLEPALIRTGPNNLLAMMRTSDTGPGESMYQARSRDGGKTWSKPTIVADHGVMPALIRTDDGILVCSYGRPGVTVICSADGEGCEWTDRTQIFDRGTTGYTDMAKVGPNEILLIHDGIYGCTELGDNKPHNYVFVVPLIIERAK